MISQYFWYELCLRNSIVFCVCELIQIYYTVAVNINHASGKLYITHTHTLSWVYTLLILPVKSNPNCRHVLYMCTHFTFKHTTRIHLSGKILKKTSKGLIAYLITCSISIIVLYTNSRTYLCRAHSKYYLTQG